MEVASTSKYFFEAGVMIHSGVFFGRNAVKASGTAQDVRWTSALRGPEWNGDTQPDAAGSVLWGLGAHEVR